MKTVMLYKIYATRICCQISSDHAGAFGAKINWKLCAVLLSIFLKVLENAACLSTHNAVGFIETQNFIHPTHVNDYFIVHGYRPSDQSSISALRHNS